MRFRLLAALFGVAVLTAACSNGESAPEPKVNGILSFDETFTGIHNSLDTGTIPQADPFFACGSRTASYAAEIVTSGPSNAKVRFEWGDVVPGHQAYASGTVTQLNFGKNGDLPFTHPFGDDMTFNLALDEPYAALAQTTGPGLNGIPPGTLHTEVAEGLIPHDSEGDYLEGFTPSDGDRVAAFGPWIIDCGHDDFHTEIHPAAVLAFAHEDGSSTVSHVFSDPYAVTQFFTPKADTVAQFDNPDRFTDPTTLVFPQYVYHLILGLLGIGPEEYHGTGPLKSHVLVDVNRNIRDVSWYVCAPESRPSGASLSVTSNFTARSGVDMTVEPDDDLGCAKVTVNIGPDYEGMPLTVNGCELDWEILNQQAAAALGTPGLDVKAAIDALVPKEIVPEINKNPIVDCYDPLQAPALGTSGGVTVDDSQPFPFYGQVEVSWKS